MYLSFTYKRFWKGCIKINTYHRTLRVLFKCAIKNPSSNKKYSFHLYYTLNQYPKITCFIIVHVTLNIIFTHNTITII